VVNYPRYTAKFIVHLRRSIIDSLHTCMPDFVTRPPEIGNDVIIIKANQSSAPKIDVRSDRNSVEM
jgi:hypothetical protein